MTKSNAAATTSKGKPTRRKPTKPYPGFPLYAHATGRWAKKIRGQLHYFGPWRDPDGALQLYLDQRDDLHAGRTPQARGSGLTLRELVNTFLTSKERQMDSGELAARSFRDYYLTCGRVVRFFGKARLVSDLRASDFEQFRAELAKHCGPVTLVNQVTRVRSVFKYAYDNGLIDQAIRYGSAFNRPKKCIVRQARIANGSRMFEAHEVRALLHAASPQLQAMVLLGVNLGYGNVDCRALRKRAIDFDTGWIDFPRPKTGVARRGPMWKETSDGIQKVIAAQRQATDLVFITKYGKPWGNGLTGDPISAEFCKLIKVLGIHRPRVGFYALRHTFETTAGGSRDQVAVDHIMGHIRDDMASVYRGRIDDERLVAVVRHVHKWLFGNSDRDG